MIRVEVMKFSNIHCFGPQNLWQPASLSRGNQIPEYLLQGCLAAFKSRNPQELFVLKSRTETDARKEDRVIFVLISRTNFSRNFRPGFMCNSPGFQCRDNAVKSRKRIENKQA
jgi:hypothetical protein